ncbi:type I 3-dehydroquinate dehydratase [Haladaptatus sp. AB618]|uniref:type I 3-dehydroquinate dehydratase n=1 Tax=Haladaptatus sp. AB618 TaxID=2934173 RepID=UPI002111F589|nr:type I 3-dehydroquinate dehydratase [Haladaptatus sp. AB618]
MSIDDFTLAAITSTLSQESRARSCGDYVEFPMSSVEDPLTALQEYEGELPLIVTNHPKPRDTEIDSVDRIDALVQASQLDPVKIVDIDLSDAKENKQMASGIETQTIVSYHNEYKTPNIGELNQIIDECSAIGDFAKFSVFAESRSDALDILQVIHGANENGVDIIGVAMGEAGLHTRIIGPFYGSRIGYAPLDEKIAEPGQIVLEELASLIESVAHGGDDVELMDVLKDNFPAVSE